MSGVDGFQYPRSDRAGCNLLMQWPPRFVPWSFSILGRIERDATRERVSESWGKEALSVSSVGSSGMQLADDFILDDADIAFQYPRSDRAGCNGECFVVIPALNFAFSILGRIERDATPHPWISILQLTYFQYPRSDRAGCNCAIPYWFCFIQQPLSVSSVGSSGMQLEGIVDITGVPAGLSVSSVGSSGMQLKMLSSVLARDLPFSILGRIERDATSRPGWTSPGRPLFQYPRSDRAGCNSLSIILSLRVRHLSVSSVGSLSLIHI